MRTYFIIKFFVNILCGVALVLSHKLSYPIALTISGILFSSQIIYTMLEDSGKIANNGKNLLFRFVIAFLLTMAVFYVYSEDYTRSRGALGLILFAEYYFIVVDLIGRGKEDDDDDEIVN